MSAIAGSSTTHSHLKWTQVRQAWQAFDLWLQHKHHNTLQRDLALSDVESAKEWKRLSMIERSKIDLKQYKAQRRVPIEENFYAHAREEWQRRLYNKGLRDEDWGEMTQEEIDYVGMALGAHLVQDDEEESASEMEDDSGMALVASPMPVPPQMTAPSLSSSSLASSISSYELVNPSDLGSDEDADDGSRYYNSIATSHDLNSEDEALGILNSTWRSGAAAGVYNPTYQPIASQIPGWSTDSSRHNSTSGSPIPSNLKSFPFDSAPPRAVHGMATVSSSSSSAQIPFNPNEQDDLWGAVNPTIQGSGSSSTMRGAPAPWAPPPTLKTATSSSTAAAAALSKSKLPSPTSSSSTHSASSPTFSTESTSTAASSYIGPTMLEDQPEPKFGEGDGERELLDAEDAEAEALLFEQFKLETRFSKIIEFHRAAAEMEMQLGLRICKLRMEAAEKEKELRMAPVPPPPKKSGKGRKAAKDLVVPPQIEEIDTREEEKRMVAEYLRAMTELRATKEEERKTMVKQERKRRLTILMHRHNDTSSITTVAGTGRRTGHGGQNGNKMEWIDEYDGVQADFDVERPSLEGNFGATNERVSQKYKNSSRPLEQHAPASPEIARPQPSHAWGPAFMHQQQGHEGDEHDDQEYGHHGEEYHEPPGAFGQPNEYDYHGHSNSNSRNGYHNKHQQLEQTFQPRFRQEEREEDHEQEMPEEILRAMAGGGFEMEFGSYKPTPSPGRSDSRGGHPSIHRASPHHMAGGYDYGSSPSPFDTNGYASDAMGFQRGQLSGGGMPGAMSMSVAGSSPVDVATPRIAPSHAAQNLWGSGRTPTKNSHLGSRGTPTAQPGPSQLGQDFMEQQAMLQQKIEQQQQQKQQKLQQQQQPTASWNRKNSTATISPEPAKPPANANETVNSTPSIAGGLSSSVGSWAKKFSLFGGATAAPSSPAPNAGDSPEQPPSSRSRQRGFFDEDEIGPEDELAEEDEEDDDEEDDEEEEEEEPVVVAPPPPPPPAPVAKGKKGRAAAAAAAAAPPPAPAPAPAPAPVVPPPTTVKGKKAARLAAAKAAAAAPVAPPPPPTPPVVIEKPKPAPAPAPVPPPAPVVVGKKGKKGKKVTKAAVVEPEPEPTPPPAPVPPPKAPTPPAEETIEEQHEEEEDFYERSANSSSKMGLWGASSSDLPTPKPPAAKPSWSMKADPLESASVPTTTPMPMSNGGAASRAQGTLRKHMFQQHQRRLSEEQMDESAYSMLSASTSTVTGRAVAGAKATSANASFGNSNNNRSAEEEPSIWERTFGSTPVNGGRATPAVAAAAAAPQPPPSRAGWRSASRAGPVSMFGDDDTKGTPPPVSSTPTTAMGLRKNSKGTPLPSQARAAFGGGGPSAGGLRRKAIKTVTLEEVPDEMDGVLDNSLPINSHSIMEPKSPDPSGRSYSPLVPYDKLRGAPSPQSAVNSRSSSAANGGGMPQVRQPKPSQPPGVYNNFFEYDQGPEGATVPASFQQQQQRNRVGRNGMPQTSPQQADWLSEATKQLKATSSSSAADPGFSTDWEGTLKGKRGPTSSNRWGGTSAMGGAQSSSSSSSAFSAASKYRSAMTDNEEMAFPGSFNPRQPTSPTTGHASAAPAAAPSGSLWEHAKAQMASRSSSSSATGQWGAARAPAAAPTPEEALFARFAQSQEREAAKRR